MKFNCTCCGACCSMINVLEPVIDKDNPRSIFYFPYSWDESGRCENLTEDNKCKVYDSRPDICSIDKMMHNYGITDKTQYYSMCVQSCKNMIDKLGLSQGLYPTLSSIYPEDNPD